MVDTFLNALRDRFIFRSSITALLIMCEKKPTQSSACLCSVSKSNKMLPTLIDDEMKQMEDVGFICAYVFFFVKVVTYGTIFERNIRSRVVSFA